MLYDDSICDPRAKTQALDIMKKPRREARPMRLNCVVSSWFDASRLHTLADSLSIALGPRGRSGLRLHLQDLAA